jgi:2-octaprenylphenol hydroxylase
LRGAIINPARHDLVVVGGGPVGASLARATRGLSVALVAQSKPSAAAELDARVYALSPGNVAFLRSLGVWQALPPERLAPVHGMQIYGDGAGSIAFDAYGAGVPELAWIVEDSVLQHALWDGLDVPIYTAQTKALGIEAEQVELELSNEARLSAKLVVGADGATSFVRRRARIAVSESDYAQAAVVANFACEKPHAHVAYQWFQRGAVLALLPLPQQRVSMVWSLPTSDAKRISALDAGSLCEEVETAAGGALGALTLVTAPRSYALRRLSAERLVAPRVALTGDAGHVIHPLAGQGLNLGLQDARVLSEVLNGREPRRDPGELRLLRRYERRRAEPILAMDTMVDSLFRLFGAEGRLAAQWRNAGLNLTDRMPVVKNILMRQAMT